MPDTKIAGVIISAETADDAWSQLALACTQEDVASLGGDPLGGVHRRYIERTKQTDLFFKLLSAVRDDLSCANQQILDQIHANVWGYNHEYAYRTLRNFATDVVLQRFAVTPQGLVNTLQRKG